jgi:TonB-dependent SusC/RagA subfamily outer membrane receptor
VKIEASSSYKLVGTWKNPVNCRSLVSTGLLIETKIKSMRHISTLFFYLVLLFSTVYAQDSSNSKIQGFKILNNQLPLTTSNSEPVVIRIRCLASNLNTEPLIVIDGVVAEKFELRNISPDDIESIWILKGTTATTLYGCRGWSGVIIITTKTANDRTIRVKDMLTGEILACANVDLISMGGRKDTIHLITDSSGKIVTNKIVYGKEYELKVSNVGYKNFRWIVSTKQLGKNYTVLLERNYEDLEEVRIKSIVMKPTQRRTNNVYFIGLYGPLRCLVAGIKVISNDQINIQDRKSSDNIKLYPNPVLHNQKVNIEIENEKDAKLTVRLFCLDGKLISSSEYQMKKGINRISYSLNGSLDSWNVCSANF